MRKAFLLFGLILIVSTTLFSAEKRTIHVTTAGTLPNYISESEKYSIEELTLTGELNGTDFRLLRDMGGCNYLGEETEGKLKVLDISGARIVAGGDKYIDTDHLPGWSGTYRYSVEKADELPQRVFQNCKFVSLFLPTTIKSIEEAALYRCTGLTSIIIPNSVMSIGNWAFCVCSGLTSVTIPNSVTSIGDKAFEYCRALTSITIPNSVTIIGRYAFESCSGLTSIMIPNSVTSIGYYAFAECSNLKGVKSDILNPYEIENTVFRNISSEALLYIPAGTKSKYLAYEGWAKNFKEIIESSTGTDSQIISFADANVKAICVANWDTNGDGELSEEEAAAVKDIGTTFISNRTITSFDEFQYFTGVDAIPNSAFYGCSGLTSITIPNSVTSIGYCAFSGCSGLTSITIPNSVTSIGGWAFSDCSGLTSVISEIQNPFEIQESVFSSDTYTNTTLTVPAGKKSAYLFTNYWNKFMNIVENETDSEQGNWVDVTEDFDKSIAFKKIRVKNMGVSSGIYCCAFFTTTPNSSSNSDTNYNINFYRLTIGDGVKEDDSSGYIYISSCKNVGDGWYEYEFKQTVYFSHYQKNAAKDQLKAFIGSYYTNALEEIRLMKDSCNTMVNKIDQTFLELTEGREFVPEHLQHLQFIFNDMKGEVNDVLSQLETSEKNIANLQEEEYYSIIRRFNEISSTILDGDSPLYTYRHYLQSGAFSCNEGGYIKVGDKIIVKNETKVLYSFYSKAFNNNAEINNAGKAIYYIEIISDEGYRISDVKRWWCSTESSYWYSINYSDYGPVFDSDIVGDGLQVEFSKIVNEMWLAELEAIRNEIMSGIERIDSLLNLGDWLGVSDKELYELRYDSQQLLDKISSTEKKVISGEATINDIDSIKDEWNLLWWYYDYIYPMELTINSQGGGYIDVDNGSVKVRNSSKHIRYLHPKPWSPFNIEIKPDDEYMVDSIVVNGRRTEKTLFSSYEIEGELVVAFKPIEESQLVLTAQSYTREYGDDNPSFDYSVSGGTIIGMPNITCSATKYSPVGTYSIKIEKGSITNGNVTYVDGTLTITKAPLTISGGTYTMKQGEALPNFVASYSGFKNGETETELVKQPTLSTTATSSSAPGTYEVTVSGAEAQNYDISYVNGTLTITQADAVIVTAKSYTREYGNANPTFGYEVSGATLDGVPVISCDATATSPVGTYPIKIAQGSVSNYNVTYVDGTLTITKAPLTITAKSYTRMQGEENPTFEVTYSGFKNGETESVLTRKPTCSTTATASSSPGTYDITVSGAEAQNYDISYVKGTLTITAESQQSYTAQGITYLLTTSTQTAEVQIVDYDLMNVDIPSSITYNGRTYTVTSIADYCFNYTKKNYVSIPSTITSISSNTFYDCIMGALIWNANSSLSKNVFNNMEYNKNFLLYVNSRSYAPSNVSNVIVGSSASSITLSDGSSAQFYCPKAFTAQDITYTHHYGMTTGGNGQGWETIALPFDVEKIEHKTKGELTPFASYQEGTSQRPFWLYELGRNGFKKAAAIKAYTPYIISMPNNSAYDEGYILAGDVTFSATNAKVTKTESLVTAESNGKHFIPAFSIVESSPSIYALNVHNDYVSYTGSYNPGSRFISDLRYIRCFEGYMTTSSAARYLGIEFDDDDTGIDGVMMCTSTDPVIEVFALGGQRIAKTSKADYEKVWQQLPAGIYIVNGRKVVKM